MLAALQEWGDDYNPPEDGVTFYRRTIDGDRPVRLGFVDDQNKPHDVSEIAFVRTENYSAA